MSSFDGELVVEPGNTLGHNETKTSLIALLRPVVRERRAGTVISSQVYDFNGDALGPDISLFGPGKQSRVEGTSRHGQRLRLDAIVCGRRRP